MGSFSEILAPNAPGFSNGTVSTTSPPSSLVDRFAGGNVGADWVSIPFDAESRDGVDRQLGEVEPEHGGPPEMGDGGEIVDHGVGAGRARSGGFLVAPPSSSRGGTLNQKRHRGLSADLLLEALGGGHFGVGSRTASHNGTNPRPPASDAAEAKRRNRADSRDLLRMAFTDDDSLAYQPPPESFSTQLLKAGLRERARSSSTASAKGRSDSFDFSSWQADFTEQFFTPPQDSTDSVLSSSILSRASDGRSRENSMWSNDDGEDILMQQIDLQI